MNTVKKLAYIAALSAGFVSLPALSLVEVQSWDFSNPPQSFVGGSTTGNSLVMTSGGVELTVTGWADTGCGWSCGNDNEIFDAELNWQWSGSSLGMYNRDETVANGTRGNNNHSIDSIDGDYDMLLLTFDEAVSLTGIDLKWATGGGGDRADISILAWDSSAGSSTLQGKTWSSILAGGGGGYVSLGNYKVGLTPYNSITPVIESTRWLIGAYNSTFGNSNYDSWDDGFKLDSLTTSIVRDGGGGAGEVPLPGSLALVLLGLAVLRDQRKNQMPA